MKDFFKFMEGLPLLVKIILCIPAIDIVWGIYRILKNYAKKSTLGLVIAILLVFPGAVITWLLDLIFVLLYGKPFLA